LAEFVEYVMDMQFDGLLGDHEARRDLLVREPVAQEVINLPLTSR
jgi:hypothetical protein